MRDKLNVGILGCGYIAQSYVEDIATYDHLHLVGVADIDLQQRHQLVASYPGLAHYSVEELLTDPEIDIIVNLTPPHSHAEMTIRALRYGSHVWSEKPLGLSTTEALAVQEVEKETGLKVGCSPFTYMGEAQQTMASLVRRGAIGQIRLAYAECNWGPPEKWHPRPQHLFNTGPMAEVGIYPISILCALFGPVNAVTAVSHTLKHGRKTMTETQFYITDDYVCADLEFTYVTARVTANWYVHNSYTRQRGIELHGDDGYIHLDSWQKFDSALHMNNFPVRLLRPGYHGTPWARGLADFAESIIHDVDVRFHTTNAIHLVEVLECIQRSIERGRTIEVDTSFEAVRMMPWAMP